MVLEKHKATSGSASKTEASEKYDLVAIGLKYTLLIRMPPMVLYETWRYIKLP